MKPQTFKWSFSCILALAMLSPAQEANLLRSIAPIKAPVIQDNRMIYTFNFIFKECPAANWWYYDSLNRQIVIEFYDNHVNVSDSISIKGQLPVEEVEIKNMATSIVLSGKRSQLVLHVKKQMHCTADCFGDTLRVVLWKDLGTKTSGKKRKKRSS